MENANNTIITATEARYLMNNWLRITETDENLFRLFHMPSQGPEKTDTGGQVCLGFYLTYHEYVQQISGIGAYRFCIRIGHDFDGQACCLIVFCVDKRNNLTSDYLRVNNAINIGYKNAKHLTHAFVTGKPTPQSTAAGMVPLQLVDTWIGSWISGLANKRIPENTFRIPSSLKVLKGYTYQINEVIDALFTNGTVVQVSRVNIFFTSHATQVATEANSKSVYLPSKGSFGFLLASSIPIDLRTTVGHAQNPDQSLTLFEEVIENQMVSTFFDIGSPCPDTCPPTDPDDPPNQQ